MMKFLLHTFEVQSESSAKQDWSTVLRRKGKTYFWTAKLNEQDLHLFPFHSLVKQKKAAYLSSQAAVLYPSNTPSLPSPCLPYK